MTTPLELYNKLRAAQAEVSDLQTKIDELKKEWPQLHNIYRTIFSDGCVRIDTWMGSDEDKCRLEIGNVFRTTEEAELEVKRCKVVAKLKAIAAKYPPCDWKNRQKIKYGIYYDHNSDVWQPGEFLSCQYPGQIYCPDERYITEALALGDELNVLIEG